jgi:hypothetical protein
MSGEFNPNHPAVAKRNADIVFNLMKKMAELKDDIAMLREVIADNALDISAKEILKIEQGKLFLLEEIINAES